MKLPVLITVPHGGVELPKEISTCRLTPDQLAFDGDTWARELYDLGDHVLAYLDTAIARAIVDLNRSPDDLPPDNPDGVVKTVTVNGKQIWSDPMGPGPALTRTLLDRYYTPWHEAVAVASRGAGLVLGLDCHTMLAIDPPGHVLAGRPRPLICLSNRGDTAGYSVEEPVTASTDLLKLLMDNLILEFQNLDVDIEIEAPQFRLNDPFRGGYICRHHSIQGPLPWLQLELSRALYLSRDIDLEPSVQDAQRLADLRTKIRNALRRTL